MVFNFKMDYNTIMKLFKLITLVILTSSFITLGGCGYTSKIVSTHKLDTTSQNNQLKYIDIIGRITENKGVEVTVSNNSSQPFETPSDYSFEILASNSSGNQYILDGPELGVRYYPDYINPGEYVTFFRYVPRGWESSDVKRLSLRWRGFNGYFKRIDL